MSSVVTGYYTGTPKDTPQGANRPGMATVLDTKPRYPATTNPGYSAHTAEVFRCRGISTEVAHDFLAEDWTTAQARDAGFGRNGRAGLAMTNFNLYGVADRPQLRPIEPAINPKNGKPRKYLWQAGDAAAIGGPPAGTRRGAERADRMRQDTTAPVIAVESLLKIASVETQARAADINCYPISIHGNWGWRRHGAPRSDIGWIPWGHKRGGRYRSRRTLILMPDSDYWTRPDVRAGWWAFGDFVRNAYGTKVLVARVPEGPGGTKWGPDDALASGQVTLQALIDDAQPLPTDMPASASRLIADPEIPEIDRLRAENTILMANQDAIIGTVRNPYLTDRKKVLAIQMAVQTLTAIEKGDAHDDTSDETSVELNAGQLSGDWRSKPKKGEAWAKTNPDGTPFLMTRGCVKGLAREFKDIGLFNLATKPVTRSSQNKPRYTDTAIVIRTTGTTLGEILGPTARYVPEHYQPRADYRSRNACPHCGEIHERTVIRTTICGSERDPDGCGSIISKTTTIQPVPVANRPDITPAQRADLDQRTTSPMGEKKSPIVSRAERANYSPVTSSGGSPHSMGEKKSPIGQSDATTTPGASHPKRKRDPEGHPGYQADAPEPGTCVDCGERPAASHDRTLCAECQRRKIDRLMHGDVPWERSA